LTETNLISDTDDISCTISLVRSIGSPFISKDQNSVKESRILYELAKKNKVGLLYLDAVSKSGRLNDLKKEYESELLRYNDFLAGMSYVHKIFIEEQLDYVFFKTLRPYPGIGRDADVMVLGQKKAYEKIAALLVKRGYKSINVSATGINLVDPLTTIDIDLQREFATNYIIWLDKSLWPAYIQKRRLPDGEHINVLSSSMEIIVAIVHDLMEQTYYLGDYYSFLYYLHELGEENLRSLGKELKENRLLDAGRVFFTITAALHRRAHDMIPNELNILLSELGPNSREADRLKKNDYRVAHKYSWTTLIAGIFEKMTELNFLYSFFNQVLHMFNVNTAKLVFLEIRNRAKQS